VELKHAGDLQLAIDTLATLSRELEQLTNAATTRSWQAREAWLRWWASADQRLRLAFADDDLTISLFRSTVAIRAAEPLASWRTTPSLFPSPEQPTSLRATPADSSHEMDVVLRERSIWVERLKAAEAEIRLLQKFVIRPGRVVVMDTSAFHEGGDFWTLDWAGITKLDPPHTNPPNLPVRLVVPLLVVDELDGQKRHPNGDVRKAARSILRELRKLPRTSADPVADVLQLNNRVTVEILLDERGHMRLGDNDAEIIDRAIYVQRLFPPQKLVTLITGDQSMEFRAIGLGMNTQLVSRHDNAPE
jgi:PIN domain